MRRLAITEAYVRDLRLPIVMILTTLFGAWLDILGPLPFDVGVTLYDWQTLIAATVASTVASIAAFIAFRNTTRSLAHNEELERRRRSRKHAALRAMLPLALAKVTDYAERSAHVLNELVGQCAGRTLPAMTAPEDLAQPLPYDALETLADFIEYSDTVDVGVLEATVAWIQIHDSRVRGLVKSNRDPAGAQLVLRVQIEGGIIDAASIYAGSGCIYEYARRRSDQIPHILSWEAVRGALRNMRFWDEEHVRLYQVVAGRENHSVGPFEKLNAHAIELPSA